MKTLLTLLTFLLFSFSVSAQSPVGKSGSLLNKANSLLNKNTASDLSSNDIVAGLKEALVIGAEKSGQKLSSPDGFFKDAAVKILMPKEVQAIEKKLRLIGMGKLVDNAVESMNRAAEDASKEAAPIFVAAIKKMTVKDAVTILKGADTAATGYLRTSTSPELISAFMPVIEEALKKVDATKHWEAVFKTYNRFSSEPVNTDINIYVTEKALDGIFHYVALEEINIRKNPAGRVTDVLKSVFGK